MESDVEGLLNQASVVVDWLDEAWLKAAREDEHWQADQEQSNGQPVQQNVSLVIQDGYCSMLFLSEPNVVDQRRCQVEADAKD